MDDRPLAATTELESISRELQQRGDEELARRIGNVIVVLRNEATSESVGGLMTTGEAANALGVKSVNTIKRWAREGLLEGVRRGGRVMVSRASVQRMSQTPALAHQQRRERELDEALDPFDAGERRLPETGLAWIGRKPWEETRSEQA